MEFLTSLLRGSFGVAVLIGICYLLSSDRKAVNWRTVGIGLGLQFILGILILKAPFVKEVFSLLASFFVVVLDFTEAGADFVLGNWPDFVAYDNKAGEGVVEIGYVFAFKVLPTIVFFSALSSLLYYLGILQVIIKGFAWVMVKTMGLTGPESLAAAANVFIGQTEAPLVVKPYLERMSRSEILCLMTGGMATIAGGVFAAYVGFLGGDDPVLRQIFATHLLTASIMSAPAAIIAAKILLPESKKIDLASQSLDIPRQEVGSNMLDAISRGTTDGIKLAVNVGAMLLVFTAFVAMLNAIFFYGIGSWTGLNDYVIESTDGRFSGFNVEYILGILFAPIAWLLGVSWEDSTLVGQLLGLKTTLNEFFAYAALEGIKSDISEKSVIIATYALCGFANFASIGIQIGGISAIAPGQRRNLTELGVNSLIGGTVACFLTAIIAGIMYTPTPQIESGVSQELSELRKTQIEHIQYDLSVDIPAAKSEPLKGTMDIAFDYIGKGDVLLDFRQPSEMVTSLLINDLLGKAIVEKDHIILPKDKLKKGPNQVRLTFQLGDLSLNRNDDFLYTLFVPDRASTAIPFFDQPNLKASYQLDLSIPGDWEAIANGPLAQTEGLANGRKRLTFAETKEFSTYVFAFTAGQFKKATRTIDGREMNMLYRESDTEKVDRNLDDIFELHARSIAWMEDYTGIAMPFQKFDFALVPGFQYGGMEHIGAIFYRESSLMLDEDPTENRLLGRASLIAHETAHMWFGDLVTMDWFNDVWLKEVFANFMAAKIVNPSFPDINHDLRFLFAHVPSALGEDRTEGSHPVQQDLDNLKNAGTLYGRIIYQKAPIVMKQLENLVGEEAFQAGLQEYLKSYSFDNATWDDLITILDEKSAIDLASWSQVWVKEATMPHYQTLLTAEEGNQVEISIEASNSSPSGKNWTQQTEVALFYADTIQTVTVQLDGKKTVLGTFPQPLAVLSNASPMAYGYFALDEASQAFLVDRANTLESPILRGAAWMALEEEMLNGQLAPEALLTAVGEALPSESEPLNRQRLLGLARGLFWKFIPAAQRGTYASQLEQSLWDLLNQTQDASARSAYWSAYVGFALSEQAQQQLLDLYEGRTSITGLNLSEPRRYALAKALALRLPEQSSQILEDLANGLKNSDRKRRLAFIQPALSPDKEVRDAFFESLKEEENRAVEPWVSEAVGLLNHPLRSAEAIDYIQPSLALLPEIQKTGDIFFPRQWVGAVLSGHQSTEAAEIVRTFLKENPDFSPRLKNKVLMAADDLFRAAAMNSIGEPQ